MVGDLKNGRTVHSLAKILTLYEGIKFRFVSPPTLGMPQEIKDLIADRGFTSRDFDSIESAMPETDVLYVTRIQKERFENEEDYEKACQNYVINVKTLFGAKDTMRILHPLPRNQEIDPEVDIDPRAAYFRQAENGKYVRMALLAGVV